MQDYALSSETNGHPAMPNRYTLKLDVVTQKLLKCEVPAPDELIREIGSKQDNKKILEAFYFSYALSHHIIRSDGKPEIRHPYDSAFRHKFRNMGYNLGANEETSIVLHDLGEEVGKSLHGSMIINDIIGSLFGEDIQKNTELMTNYYGLAFRPIKDLFTKKYRTEMPPGGKFTLETVVETIEHHEARKGDAVTARKISEVYGGVLNRLVYFKGGLEQIYNNYRQGDENVKLKLKSSVPGGKDLTEGDVKEISIILGGLIYRLTLIIDNKNILRRKEIIPRSKDVYNELSETVKGIRLLREIYKSNTDRENCSFKALLGGNNDCAKKRLKIFNLPNGVADDDSINGLRFLVNAGVVSEKYPTIAKHGLVLPTESQLLEDIGKALYYRYMNKIQEWDMKYILQGRDASATEHISSMICKASDIADNIKDLTKELPKMISLYRKGRCFLRSAARLKDELSNRGIDTERLDAAMEHIFINLDSKVERYMKTVRKDFYGERLKRSFKKSTGDTAYRIEYEMLLLMKHKMNDLRKELGLKKSLWNVMDLLV